VLVTVLALLKTTLEGRGALRPGTVAMQALLYLILVMPIVISILIAASNRFPVRETSGCSCAPPRKTVKREIFRYRVRAGAYRDADARETVLAQSVENITRRLARSEVNTSALAPYEGPIPPRGVTAEADADALARLTPQRYVAQRLLDQLAYYRRRAAKLDRQLTTLQWSILLLGGVATFLAAIGLGTVAGTHATIVTLFGLSRSPAGGGEVDDVQPDRDGPGERGGWGSRCPQMTGTQRTSDKASSTASKIFRLPRVPLARDQARSPSRARSPGPSRSGCTSSPPLHLP